MHYAGMAWTLDTEVASAEDVRSYWENAAPIWEVIYVGQQLSGLGAALQPMIGRTSAAVLVVCFLSTPLIGAPLRGRRGSLRSTAPPLLSCAALLYVQQPLLPERTTGSPSFLSSVWPVQRFLVPTSPLSAR